MADCLNKICVPQSRDKLSRFLKNPRLQRDVKNSSLTINQILIHLMRTHYYLTVSAYRR